MRNPFTERGRIIEPAHFAGRWGELSLILERLEAGRPVLFNGVPGIGKSSLLTHLSQSAAVGMDIPDLRSFYLDLADAPDEPAVFQVMTQALGGRGNTPAAMEVALLEYGRPVLTCLDNAHVVIADGWGEHLLETLARMSRGQPLMLVVAVEGPLPLLSEPYATLTLGAMATTEMRLIADAYLDETDVRFTPDELRELAQVSAMHPSYVQRAAFHLFESKRQPGYNWRQAYFREAREQPVPGSPLPPEAFSGESDGRGAESSYNDGEMGQQAGPAYLSTDMDLRGLLVLLVPLLLGTVVYLASSSGPIALGVALVGAVVVLLVQRRLASPR